MENPIQGLRTVARLSQGEAVRVIVRENARAVGFSEREIFACELAADEAFANIVLHGYGGESDRPVILRCRRGRNHLLISFVDFGRPWEPLPPRPPEWAPSFENLAVGGLGRLIMHRSMDWVKYRRRGDRNSLLMCKSRQPAGMPRS